MVERWSRCALIAVCLIGLKYGQGSDHITHHCAVLTAAFEQLCLLVLQNPIDRLIAFDD
jgi:hypothetical protein